MTRFVSHLSVLGLAAGRFDSHLAFGFSLHPQVQNIHQHGCHGLAAPQVLVLGPSPLS
jgi:hypothetical protein